MELHVDVAIFINHVVELGVKHRKVFVSELVILVESDCCALGGLEG